MRALALPARWAILNLPERASPPDPPQSPRRRDWDAVSPPDKMLTGCQGPSETTLAQIHRQWREDADLLEIREHCR